MSLSFYEPTAEKIVHNTGADFILRYIGEVIHVVQYDDSLPIVAVALYRNGKPYTVSAEEVNIRYGKPDGTFVYNPALGRNKAGNVVYFEVTQQMTSAPGKARLAVEVVDGGTACSGIVMMEVERNPVQEDAIESTDEFQTVGQQIEEKVQDVRAEMSDILAAKQDYFVAAIDLSGSQYDQDTWYPVTGTYIPKSGLHKIHVYSNFDVGAHPSWATNSAGYTCNMEIYDKAQTWGQADGAAICLDYSWKHTNQRPCGYVQMTHSSTPVLILRGGGIYKVITDYESEWEVRTEAYTLSGDTVRPAAQSRFDFKRATVFADIDGDVTGNVTGTLNGFNLEKTVPADAVFTDTVYTHPTVAGNKHIPSGGSRGQILRWSADGTAVWDDEMVGDVAWSQVDELKVEIQTLKEQISNLTSYRQISFNVTDGYYWLMSSGELMRVSNTSMQYTGIPVKQGDMYKIRCGTGNIAIYTILGAEEIDGNLQINVGGWTSNFNYNDGYYYCEIMEGTDYLLINHQLSNENGYVLEIYKKASV